MLRNLMDKCWKSSQSATKILLRAFGLNLVVSGIRSLKRLAVGRGYDEQIKVAIRRSRKVALLRALIHIPPFCIAVWEVALNFNTYYVGTAPLNQAYYQFGAKLHEMTAQASLAAIVFSYVRHELSLGQGLPFGALFSGLQVTQGTALLYSNGSADWKIYTVSYLWSMEFWGSIFSKHLPLSRRFGMIVVISVAIILAAGVGPSSAILLIPRLAFWPAGSTDIWLNVTSQELWPSRTDGSLVPLSCLQSDDFPLNNGCPSNGWQSVQTFLGMTNNLIPGEYDRLLNLGPISPGWAQVTGRNSLRQLLFVHVNNYSPGYPRVFIAGTSEHNAVADALSSIAALWDLAVNNVTTTGHGSMQLQLDTVHSITEHYYQPYALASCEHDVILGQSDQRPVMFPVPPGVSPQMLDAGEVNNSTLSLAQDSTPTGYAFEFSGLSRSQILETPGLSSKDRLRWVELPQNPFNGTAIGAIVLLARDPSNATQELLMCNVAAGWGVSTLNVSSNLGTTALVQSQVDIKNLYNASMGWSLKNPNTEISSPLEETAVIRTYGFFDLPMFPQLPIAVTEDWARYLNPSVSNTNTTVFETLMASNLGPLHMVQTVQTILVELIVNGLSSIGSESQLQGTLKTVVRPDNSSYIDGSYWFSGKGNIFKVDPVESQDWVKLHISSEFQGFAYNVNGATPKIAVAFLLAYCIFVLAHVLYVCIYGISSTCWDSIAEVTALAMNSTPTVALRNTCAGITELDIFKIPVRVLAARDEEGSDREHLELVFEYADGKTTELGHSTMKADRSYGTLPLMTKHVKTS